MRILYTCFIIFFSLNLYSQDNSKFEKLVNYSWFGNENVQVYQIKKHLDTTDINTNTKPDILIPHIIGNYLVERDDLASNLYKKFIKKNDLTPLSNSNHINMIFEYCFWENRNDPDGYHLKILKSKLLKSNPSSNYQIEKLYEFYKSLLHSFANHKIGTTIDTHRFPRNLKKGHSVWGGMFAANFYLESEKLINEKLTSIKDKKQKAAFLYKILDYIEDSSPDKQVLAYIKTLIVLHLEIGYDFKIIPDNYRFLKNGLQIALEIGDYDSAKELIQIFYDNQFFIPLNYELEIYRSIINYYCKTSSHINISHYADSVYTSILNAKSEILNLISVSTSPTSEYDWNPIKSESKIIQQFLIENKNKQYDFCKIGNYKKSEVQKLREKQNELSDTTNSIKLNNKTEDYQIRGETMNFFDFIDEAFLDILAGPLSDLLGTTFNQSIYTPIDDEYDLIKEKPTILEIKRYVNSIKNRLENKDLGEYTIYNKDSLWVRMNRTFELLDILYEKHSFINYDKIKAEILWIYEDFFKLSYNLKKNDEILEQLSKLKSLYTLTQLSGYSKFNIDTLVEKAKFSLSNNEMYLDFFFSDKISFVVLLNKNTFKTHAYKHSYQDIKEAITQLQSNLINKGEMSQIDSLSKMVYKMLFMPIKSHLQERLIISADKELSYIPLEIITEYSTHQKLLDNHEIVYTYSLPLYLETLTDKKIKNTNKVLCIRPDYSNTPLRTLPYAQTEIKNIQHVTNTIILENDKATKEEFIEKSTHHHIIHLAMHADAYDDDFQNSYLAFTGNTNNKLTVRDIDSLNLQLNCEMVALNGCETAYGELSKGEGLQSIAKGFIQAGSQSVVANMWSVDDKASSQIITNFYQYLKQGFSKSKALQMAKLSYLKSAKGRYKHPYYWSPLVVIGNPKEIHIAEKTWEQTIAENTTLFILTCSLLIILICIFIYKRYFHNESVIEAIS